MTKPPPAILNAQTALPHPLHPYGNATHQATKVQPRPAGLHPIFYALKDTPTCSLPATRGSTPHRTTGKRSSNVHPHERGTSPKSNYGLQRISISTPRAWGFTYSDRDSTVPITSTPRTWGFTSQTQGPCGSPDVHPQAWGCTGHRQMNRQPQFVHPTSVGLHRTYWASPACLISPPPAPRGPTPT